MFVGGHRFLRLNRQRRVIDAGVGIPGVLWHVMRHGRLSWGVAWLGISKIKLRAVIECCEGRL